MPALLQFPWPLLGKNVWSLYSYTHCSVIHPDLRSLLAISHALFIIIPGFVLFLPSSPPTQLNHPLKCSVLLFWRFSKLALSLFSSEMLLHAFFLHRDHLLTLPLQSLSNLYLALQRFRLFPVLAFLFS